MNGLYKMNTVDLTTAKAKLGELVERAAAGEPVAITRRGRTIACIVAAESPRKRVDAAHLRGLTDQMPLAAEGTETFVRLMRNEDRY